MKNMKNGKAAGPEDVPPEFWKIVAENGEACGALLQVCQACWETKAIPAKWRKANVILLFKKGDSSLPSNYRPISLLAVGY